MGKVFFCGHVGRNLLRVSDTTIFVGQVTAILEDGRRFEGDLLVKGNAVASPFGQKQAHKSLICLRFPSLDR
jgi:uncharacterized protein (DUF1330 family)